jgi:hypothetical protein
MFAALITSSNLASVAEYVIKPVQFTQFIQFDPILVALAFDVLFESQSSSPQNH